MEPSRSVGQRSRRRWDAVQILIDPQQFFYHSRSGHYPSCTILIRAAATSSFDEADLSFHSVELEVIILGSRTSQNQKTKEEAIA